MKQISYEYHNMPIPGGGYVTGLLYHPNKKGLLYLRTDIGGVYRFDEATQNWKSLIRHVTMENLSETYPISIAIDEKKSNRLYIACGINEEQSGVLAVSEDYGESFQYKKIPVRIHGNLNGRGTGERLILDPKKENRLFFASQTEGLWRSDDNGDTWHHIEAMEETHLTFVGFIGDILLVGTAGLVKRDSLLKRGHSLYYSKDCGIHFKPMEEPAGKEIEGCRLNGLVAQRFCEDDLYLYVTFSSTGRRSYVLDLGYSCDSGDVIDGHIVRYKKEKDGTLGAMEDITPMPDESVEWGYSGICVSKRKKGLVLASSLVKDDGDCIYLSEDYGKTWKTILWDLSVGSITFRAPYMKPEYNGGHSLIHWLSCLEMNPFDETEVWFNSGTGVFRSRDIGLGNHFTDWSDGIEETVHLNVYSLPNGEVQVIDIVGDLGGFVFTDIDKPCENSFADEQGNRYITCMNADFSDAIPTTIVVTPRGNWTGKTLGGLILSKNQGKSFTRLPMPFGLSAEIDRALEMMERPNVNSGWCALSPDTQHIVWSIAKGNALPISLVVCSHDQGKTFEKVRVFDISGREKTDGMLKVFSNRCESHIFYGFGAESELYLSIDFGKTFFEIPRAEGFPTCDFGKIDCANKTEVRAEAGKNGIFYIATGKCGLWKLYFNDSKRQCKAIRLSKESDCIYRIGLGIGRKNGDYFKEPKALYMNGYVEGVYGFYRSFDDGKTMERINTDMQMFGEINSIDGDCRTFGRFFLATGSNGLIYGQEK